MREFTLSQLIERADDPAVNQFTRGVSPGAAAEILGVSRQRVHKLLDDGLIDGVRILDARGNLAAILISLDSLRKRVRDRRRAA